MRWTTGMVDCPYFHPPYMTGLNDWHNEWLDNLIDGPYW